MSIGDLIGIAVATYNLFTATEVLPALFWLDWRPYSLSGSTGRWAGGEILMIIWGMMKMSKERMVQVTKEEYENLIRDQHTVELLTGYVQEQSWMMDSMICLLLGIQKSERELPPGWYPVSEPATVTEDVPLPAPAMETPAEEEKKSPPRRAREEIGQKEDRPWKSNGAASGRLVEQENRG